MKDENFMFDFESHSCNYFIRTNNLDGTHLHLNMLK